MPANLIPTTMYMPQVGNEPIGHPQSTLEAAKAICLQNDPGPPKPLIVVVFPGADSPVPVPLSAFRYARDISDWVFGPARPSTYKDDPE